MKKQKQIERLHKQLKAILSEEYYNKVCDLIELELETELNSNN